MDTVTRFVLTFVNENGTRQMMGPCQGRYTYTTAEEAEKELALILSNNNYETLVSHWGNPELFAVRACRCHAGHFDPVGIYFDD